jgi:uncharacterized SAM-binding protein YcdF (DUF218 family)
MAGVYHAGLFPVLVFTGANSPTNRARFPRGEAVHYTEQATALGVPQSAIIIEPRAANTGQNISYSRQALTDAGITPRSVMLISKPYMQRRAYATARHLWPEVSVVCMSEDLSLAEQAGDDKLVSDMLVGDLQRIIEYPAKGFAFPQPVPDQVQAAYRRLIAAGFTSRLSTLVKLFTADIWVVLDAEVSRVSTLALLRALRWNGVACRSSDLPASVFQPPQPPGGEPGHQYVSALTAFAAAGPELVNSQLSGHAALIGYFGRTRN